MWVECRSSYEPHRDRIRPGDRFVQKSTSRRQGILETHPAGPPTLRKHRTVSTHSLHQGNLGAVLDDQSWTPGPGGEPSSVRQRRTTMRVIVWQTVVVLGITACGSTSSTDASTAASAAAVETYEAAAPPLDELRQLPGVPITTPPVVDGTAPAEPTKMLVPGRTYSLEVNTHCGVATLGREVHGQMWWTDESDTPSGWMPSEWRSASQQETQMITLLVVLSADESQLAASYAGRTVVYRPMTSRDPFAPCA
jgi:hypothetical protein